MSKTLNITYGNKTILNQTVNKNNAIMYYNLNGNYTVGRAASPTGTSSSGSCTAARNGVYYLNHSVFIEDPLNGGLKSLGSIDYKNETYGKAVGAKCTETKKGSLFIGGYASGIGAGPKLYGYKLKDISTASSTYQYMNESLSNWGALNKRARIQTYINIGYYLCIFFIYEHDSVNPEYNGFVAILLYDTSLDEYVMMGCQDIVWPESAYWVDWKYGEFNHYIYNTGNGYEMYFMTNVFMNGTSRRTLYNYKIIINSTFNDFSVETIQYPTISSYNYKMVTNVFMDYDNQKVTLIGCANLPESSGTITERYPEIIYVYKEINGVDTLIGSFEGGNMLVSYDIDKGIYYKIKFTDSNKKIYFYIGSSLLGEYLSVGEYITNTPYSNPSDMSPFLQINQSNGNYNKILYVGYYKPSSTSFCGQYIDFSINLLAGTYKNLESTPHYFHTAGTRIEQPLHIDTYTIDTNKILIFDIGATLT